MKNAFALFTTLCLFLTLTTACGTSGDQVHAFDTSLTDSFEDFSTTSSVPVLSSQTAIATPALATPLTNSMNLDTVEEVNEKFILPLNPNTTILRISWSTPSQIAPNDLVDFCAYNHLTPTVSEGEYIYSKGIEVESAIQQYFGVSIAYLESSTLYNPETELYLQVDRSSDEWSATAESWALVDDLLSIEVTTYPPNGSQPLEGTLVVSIQSETEFKYQSYTIKE